MKNYSISGFPEWLPRQKQIEQSILDQIREQFELCGYVPVETRAIEPLDVLLHKGDDKEIYVLKRLHDNTDSTEADRFGLHFDLTVPFARYVQQHESKLVFPFKRYQIQKVWRGERKQEGRYREFYQCDLDVIAKDKLPLYFEAELPFMVMNIWQKLAFPRLLMKLSNRKVLQGFYQGLGVTDIISVLRILDKLAKVGPEQVAKLLSDELALPAVVIEACLSLAEIRSNSRSFMEEVESLGVKSELLNQGLAEMQTVVQTLDSMGMQGTYEVDFSIARGLDYYTGTVYEAYMSDHQHLGAVCSGGRYDKLARVGQHNLPGVGLSLGITRILGYFFNQPDQKFLADHLVEQRLQVLVVLPDESDRVAALKIACKLRARGIGADVYHQAQSFGKQMRQAEKRGIPYVWFMQEQGSDQVKHLASGTQTEADAEHWVP